MFSNYPPALDPNNQQYTVAELHANNTEKPYPSTEINSPPAGRINYTSYPPTGTSYTNYFIGVQSVVIDPADRLWVLDTGRAATSNGTQVPAAFGGPKLIGIDLTTDQIFQTIVFDPTAAPADSVSVSLLHQPSLYLCPQYLNDIRFDLTQGSAGFAYITDSSPEGRNAIVVVDLGSGTAWRHLMGTPYVRPTQGFVPTIWGQPIYSNGTTGLPIMNVNFGADGIALSPDGSTLYFSTTGGRELYSIATSLLRDNGLYSELMVQAAVYNHGQKGLSDGLETDSNGFIYVGNIEDNSIATFDPSTGVISTFVRDPRFSWTDTMSVAADGYIYFTENQLWRGPAYNGGVEKRVKPFVLFKAKLPNGATKVQQSAPGGNGTSVSSG